jgi:hypothetical protein
MAEYFVQQGDHSRALVAGQRAVTLAETFAEVTLQVETNYWLGTVHYALGDYHQAMECCRRSMAAIPSDRLYERFALGGLPEGSVYLDEAVRIAERG